MTALVKFIDLQCQVTEDNGADEVYLNFNGGRVWGGEDGVEVSQGQARGIDVIRTFDGTAIVTLHDEDWPDSDDFLGQWQISENEANNPMVRIATFTGDDAHYTIRYQVGRPPF